MPFPTYPPPGAGPSWAPPGPPPPGPPPGGGPLPEGGGAPPVPGGPPDGGDGPFLDTPGAAPATRGVAALWFLFALLGYLVGQVVGTVFVLVAAATQGKLHHLSQITSMATPPAWYIGTSLVGLWVGFFLAPLVASKARGTGRLVADFGLRFRPIDLLGILIGVGGQFAIGALYAPFHLKNLTGPAQKLTGGSHGVDLAVIALLTVVGAPFFEELFFRGVLYRSLARLFVGTTSARTTGRAVAVVLAVVVDGLLFGAVHAEPAQFAGLALFGMVLATVYHRTGRMGMNMISHASFNLVAILSLLSTNGGLVLH